MQSKPAATESNTVRYTVLVDDNFHYMDASERYTLDSFHDCASAVAACMKIVDDFLRSEYKPGMSAGKLYELYTMFGDDPFITGTDRQCKFSAWDYARRRCDEICRSGTGL